MTLTMPKLKINRFQWVHDLPIDDEFKTRSIDDRVVKLTVHKNGEDKYFLIHTTFQAIGWTVDPHKAFEFYHNVDLFTLEELYELARGKKV